MVLDEYTSVVDRTVAQIGSAALAKTVRQRGQQFVAVTCHEDVEVWLQPDWVYRPAENLFAWRSLRRRPAVTLEIVRCAASAWPLFAPHHYLSAAIAPSAVCFLASWREQPVAFSAWLPHFGPGPKARREHRTVTLPDYQGVGIGNALSDFIASLWMGLGYAAYSTTTHPAMIRARLRSPNWHMHRRPSFASSRRDRVRHATTRLTAGFRYVGPPLPYLAAKTLLEALK
jgi:GNAT superfamily N-acetyltransferase